MSNDDDSTEFLDRLLAEDDKEVDTHREEDEILAPLLNEINQIQDEAIRLFTRSILLRAKPWFWTMPASFSGKYHPPDERGEAGNVIHTQRVFRMARFICESYGRTQLESDMVMSAALLHDLNKGIEKDDGFDLKYDPMHPYTVDRFVENVREKDKVSLSEGRSSSLYLEEEIIAQIMRMVRCHLGQWSPIPETIPITPLDWTLHLADYLCSNLHTITDHEVNAERWKGQTSDGT